MENNDVVILELDRPRELRLTHKVLKRFCAKHKIRLSDLSIATDNYDTLIDLLLTMLQREDPSLTAAQLDDMLDEIPFVKIVRSVGKAIEAAFPEESDEKADGEDEENPQKEAGTGTDL